MPTQTNAPVIIKRKKIVGGDGHHGGAWKVAYADFVTAMMAFFMLMWLLNATTEKQRKGIADYFSPTIPIVRISGGGDGSYGGESVFSEELLAETGEAPMQTVGQPVEQESSGGEVDAESTDQRAFSDVEEALTGLSGESMAADDTLRHIVTRVTDEGLVIELFALDDERLFEIGSSDPTPILVDLSVMISDILILVTNKIAVEGHVRSQPIVLADNQNWSLSQARANRVRSLFEVAGTQPERMARITGHSDRERVVRNPLATRNNRIEIILLRSDIVR
jgi:chemotaxis protein MotB